MARDVHSILEPLAGKGGDPALVGARVVAIATAITAFAVAQVVWFLSFASTSGTPQVVAETPPYAGLLAIVAALALLAAPFAERWLLAREARPGDATSRNLSPYALAKTVGFMLRELAALCGFALALLTGVAWWSYGLSAAALTAMALAWPRASDLPTRTAGNAPGPVEPG